MSATLEVPGQTRMMVVPARLNLRRASSYTGFQNDKLPLSATSSSFNINRLLFSPPPSPGLPVLVTRPRKSSNAPRPSQVFRYSTWIIGFVVVMYLARAAVFQSVVDVPIVSWAGKEQYEMVGQDDLPDFPTPIAVTDRRGRPKWTISIPPTSDFPLSVREYVDMCEKCQEVAAHVRELQGSTYPSPHAQANYYYEDPYFLDVGDAERRGLLPGVEVKGPEAATNAQSGKTELIDRQSDSKDMDVCRTSLTFVLESTEAGLGASLMMLWMSYGLAQKEKRAFFVDDSRWAYGNYTDFFQVPPAQGCRSPPRHEIVPCPHHARHLVVSAATARETFGASFSARYQLRKSDINRERPMFDLARAGYEALFHLNTPDATYVTDRVKNLKAESKAPKHGRNDGAIVGVHVRHGDQRPLDYEYSDTYLPLILYTEKAREIIDGRFNMSGHGSGENAVLNHQSTVLVASDDPIVYQSEEFAHAMRAQERIQLAAIATPDRGEVDKSIMHKFIDEAFGWEGGFFASMFWNLGHPKPNNALSAQPTSTDMTMKPAAAVSADTLQLRGLIGRAYLMDLGVLAQGADSVICAVSAMGCRLLAVMMGWEKAMEQGGWVNLDGNYQWTAFTF